MFSTVLFIGALVSLSFANLLTSDDQNTIATLVNQARNDISSTIPKIAVDSNLVSLADSWTSKCTLKPDRKLKWLYSEVSFAAQQQLDFSDVIQFWLSESDVVRSFQAYELQYAGNWTTLLWEKSTKFGCSLSSCGNGNDTTYFFGCLVSPKGRFPGLMPFTPKCNATTPIDCVAKGGCGEYYDGCKVVQCGPTCGSTGSRVSWVREAPLQLQNTLFSTADDTSSDATKRGNTISNTMWYGYYIQSANGNYRAIMQRDGNFVVKYRNGTILWSTRTGRSSSVYYAIYVQSDGNLVLYDTNNWQAQWASNTNGQGTPNYRLTMQDDGNLVLYDSTNKPYWASNTAVKPTPTPTPVPDPTPVPVTPLTTQAVTTQGLTTQAPAPPTPVTTKSLTTAAPPQVPVTTKAVTTQLITTKALTTSPLTPPPSPTPSPTPSDLVDWRTKGYVSAVKNQRSCGSCWAFTATQVIETQYAFKYGSLPTLAPEHVLSCSGAGSCDGGWMNGVYSWAEDVGVVTETQFPYVGYEQPEKCSSQPSNGIKGSQSGGLKRVESTASAMEDYVRKYGSLSVGFRVEDEFYGYSSGVYTTRCQASGANHAVQIVGFGTDGTGLKYWIIRNSWGSRWGNGGFFLMQRGVNLCEVESYPASFIPA